MNTKHCINVSLVEGNNSPTGYNHGQHATATCARQQTHINLFNLQSYNNRLVQLIQTQDSCILVHVFNYNV